MVLRTFEDWFEEIEDRLPCREEWLSGEETLCEIEELLDDVRPAKIARW